MINAIAKPFGWLLMQLFELVGNYGLAIIIFALLVKLILLPFMMKSKRGMMKNSRIQPKIKELEARHGANKAKYNEEVRKLYQEEKVSPLGGCFWSIIQFPILIALYQAIRFPLTIMMGVSSKLLEDGGTIALKLEELKFSTTISSAYEQIAQAQFISNHFDSFAPLSDKLHQISYSFLGMDLGTLPDWKLLWSTDWSAPSVWLPGLGLFLIPFTAALLTYLSSLIANKMNPTPKNPDKPDAMQTMTVIFPIVTIWFGFIMPAAVGLYWIASTFFGVIQDYLLTKRYTRILDAEDAARLSAKTIKEAELEAKRAETERLRAENATALNPNTSKRKQQKLSRIEQQERLTEYEKKTGKLPEKTVDDPSREGNRRYARGRAYDPERFNASGTDSEEAPGALSAQIYNDEDKITNSSDTGNEETVYEEDDNNESYDEDVAVEAEDIEDDDKE